MKIDDVNVLRSNLANNKVHSVCILDNNSIEFLRNIENNISVEEFFKNYDLVLLPRWVEVEVNDSLYRTQYIERISELEDIQFCCISEYRYLDLLNGRDSFLFIIFQELIRLDTKVNGFINREILKGKPIEDLPHYEEWLELFYDNAFDKSTLKNGRIKRKNAGEISIAVIAFIISRFYEVEYVTVISQDGGTYEMIRRAESDISSKIAVEYDNPITFKSNDCIIKEFYKLCNLTDRVNREISKLRNPRKLKYTKLKEDRSVEERCKIVGNDEFLELLQDETVQIIF